MTAGRRFGAALALLAGALFAAAQEPAPSQPTFGPDEDWEITFDGAQVDLGPGQYLAEGHVAIRHGDAVLRADKVRYDQAAAYAEAEGNVEIEWPGLRVKGARATYSFRDQSGSIEQVEAEGTDQPFFFTARRLERIDRENYVLYDGEFTTCDQPVPNWSLSLRKAKLRLDGYLTVYQFVMKVKHAPVFYTPFMLWPVKEGRATGFLLPTFGNSDRRGILVSNAFYLAPSDGWDATTYVDYYSKEGIGVGQEVRYHPLEGVKGILQAYWIHQRSDDANRWRVTFEHDQDLPDDWKLTVRILRLSDILFPRDYRRDFNTGSLSQVASSVLVTKTADWGSFNLKAEQQEQFFTTTESVKQTYLPEAELRLRLRRLGNTGLFGGVNLAAAWLQREVSRFDGLGGFEILDDNYARFDAHPFLEWPAVRTPAFELTLRLDARGTWYGDSADPLDNALLTGDNLFRFSWGGSVSMRGPRLFHVYHLKSGRYKHLLEPEVEYRFVSDPDEAARVPILDEVDRIPLDQSVVRYALNSRLFRKSGEEGEGSQREVLLFRISQDYSFNRDLSANAITGDASRFSPITALLRWWARQNLSAELRLRYNHLDHSMDSESLSLHMDHGETARLSLSYIRAQTYGVSQTGATGPTVASEQLRFAGGLRTAEGRLSLSAAVDWDILRDTFQNQRLIVGWNTSCGSFGIESSARDIVTFEDDQVRFLFSLKGSTPFLDIPGQP